MPKDFVDRLAALTRPLSSVFPPGAGPVPRDIEQVRSQHCSKRRRISLGEYRQRAQPAATTDPVPPTAPRTPRHGIRDRYRQAILDLQLQISLSRGKAKEDLLRKEAEVRRHFQRRLREQRLYKKRSQERQKQQQQQQKDEGKQLPRLRTTSDGKITWRPRVEFQ